MTERFLDWPDDVTRKMHEHRYQVAGRYTKHTDVVLDAACGSGYGRAFLRGEYIGVDKADLGDNIVADLTTWTPDFAFDCGVCLETLEHLTDYRPLVESLKKAKRLVVYSVPIIPTKHINPYHLHDFTYDEAKLLFDGWHVIYEEKQDNRYGIFVVSHERNILR